MEMNSTSYILNELRDERERRGISSSEIAQELNIASDWIEAVENGEVMPSLEWYSR